MDEPYNNEGTKFNMAMLLYMEIHDLRSKKSQAMLDDNLPLSYECIQELYSTVSFKFDQLERINILNLLEVLKSKFNNEEFKEAKQLLREVDRKISETMNKYHMIFPRIESQGGLLGLQKKYGINSEVK
jgi:hypothetical protein